MYKLFTIFYLRSYFLEFIPFTKQHQQQVTEDCCEDDKSCLFTICSQFARDLVVPSLYGKYQGTHIENSSVCLSLFSACK